MGGVKLSPAVLKELEQKSLPELEEMYHDWLDDKEKHDHLITVRDELLLRRQEKYAREVAGFTKWITVMTFLVLLATILNLFL